MTGTTAFNKFHNPSNNLVMPSINILSGPNLSTSSVKVSTPLESTLPNCLKVLTIVK